MIAYKISNQRIKRIPCDQREYSGDLFTGNRSVGEKIKERTVITTEKDHSNTNQMSSLDFSMARLIKVSEGGNAPAKECLGETVFSEMVRTRNMDDTMYKTLFKMEYLDNKNKKTKQ